MDAPEEFVAFVARYEPEVRAVAEELTGSDSLLQRARRDIFASVAARWEWLTPNGRWARLRPPPDSRWPRRLRRDDTAPERQLLRAIGRTRRNWSREYPSDSDLQWEVLDSDNQRYTWAPLAPPSPKMVATEAWELGLRLRRRRNLAYRGGAAVLVLLAFLLPRAGQEPGVTVEPEVVLTLPANLPANVSLLPLTLALDRLPARTTTLPKKINADPAAARPLATSPLPRAVAVIRDGLGPLVLVAADGSTRRLDPPAIGDAEFLTTSVSPDGQRVVLVGNPFLMVVNVSTGKVSKVRSPADAQPAQTRLLWSGSRAVMVPGAVGATIVNVDTGVATFDTSVSVLNVVVAQGPARSWYLSELMPAAEGRTSAQIRIRPSPPPASGSPGPADVRPISAPSWMGQWLGQGWGNGSLYIRPCDAKTLLLPFEVGVAQDPLGVVDDRGLAVRTLTGVEQGVTLTILGWLGPDHVLIRAAKGQTSWLVAWQPRTEEVTLAATVVGRGRVAVADLYGA